MKTVIEIDKAKIYIKEFVKGDLTLTDHLYLLIQNKKHNISNVSPPSRKQHEKFCLNHPYRFWFLIYERKNLLGSVYFTYQNSIGINFIDITDRHNELIIRHLVENIDPMPAIPSEVQTKFFCNVSPKNTKLIKLLESLGAELSQVSFKFK
tara:strand:- start:784 stop:1236 length:453 start_codon:yes stop_codon:yes gene_type:complete